MSWPLTVWSVTRKLVKKMMGPSRQVALFLVILLDQVRPLLREFIMNSHFC